MQEELDLVVVANRLPVHRVDNGDETTWETSPGGLVSALVPTLAGRKVAWVGWTGDEGIEQEPFMHEGMTLVPVGMSTAEVASFYTGFSNGTLWPLYHDAIQPSAFHREWWRSYQAINRRFAEKVAGVAGPGATVWVHDYHLQLVPALLRALRPDLRIGFFLHIPYPPQELFMRLPWRYQILEGLLGADVVGFQVPVAAENFAVLARRLLAAHGSLPVLSVRGRPVRVGAFPISINVAEFEEIAARDSVVKEAALLRERMGAPRVVLLGVDRLDYTKGIEARLRAYHELLQDGLLHAGECVLVQIAVPSREDVPAYGDERERIERLVGEINGDYGDVGAPAVHYIHRGVAAEELVVLYRAADVMLVTPYRDGMNLVAKEYVASRLDDLGTLVLSEFAGAARELSGAMLVNPHDTASVKEAIVAAVRTSEHDARRRMRTNRRAIRRWTVHDWSKSFLDAVDAVAAPDAAPAAAAEAAPEARWMIEAPPDIRTLARTPHLLVACDYDGTLAPIVDDPTSAPPLPGAIAALRSLAALHNTSVAVISGRALRDLALMSRLPSEVHLVGSHGSEMDAGFAVEIPRERQQVLAEMARELDRIAASTPGAKAEHKPMGVALHVRLAERGPAADALREAEALAHSLPDVSVRHGKEVIELAVLHTNKGEALNRVRHTVGATAVLFVGDDLTDEDAFATLSGPDIGVKVGEGDSCAMYRIADPDAVVHLIAELGELRHSWLFGTSVTPIEHHSLLSDQRTAALVTDQGNITWLCHPRLDSSALFGELLGGPTAGSFMIRPAGTSEVLSQRYLPGSLMVETRWPELTVLDYLDCPPERAIAAPGRTDLLRVISGTGEAHIRFAPRPDFGRTSTQLRVDGGTVELLGSSTSMVLVAPSVTWTIEHDGMHQTAQGVVHLGSEPCVLELRMGTREVDARPRDEAARRRATDAHWRTWSQGLRIPSVAPELVLRSALTIKALCFGPSGAIAAAATTSLPEELGGVRNWDYRYCWIRDAALAATALARIGSPAEGLAYLDWLTALVDRTNRPEQLQPVYALDGGVLGPEAVIAELSGYAGSRPVRVGNAADHQVQLDVFGPVAMLVDLLDRSGAKLTDRHFRLLEQLAEAVLRRWHEPDHGIWEERIASKHHVHSKVMCWTTLDRAAAVFERHQRPGRGALEAVRDHIRDEVLARGWNPQVGSFTASYESTDLDAATLFVGLSGMLPGTDERFVATVKAVESTLRKGPVVMRYLHDDGLPGREGGFIVCALWLAEAYLLCGRDVDAVDLFDQVRGLAGPTGLLSEQFDPRLDVALGNVAQTYSHHAIIDMAVRLDAGRTVEAPRRAKPWSRLRPFAPRGRAQ